PCRSRPLGIAVVGGNITRLPERTLIDITVLGRVRRSELVRRSTARPGDQVLVTGTLGDAAAGLRLALEPHLHHESADDQAVLNAYLQPQPRLPEAALLARAGWASAMIDLSDGLSGDIQHICQQSSVGVQLHADWLPLSAAMPQVARRIGMDPWQLALTGGDDYELCFTANPAHVEPIIATLGRETGTTVTVIGAITAPTHGRQVRLPDGRDVSLDSTSWQHFALASTHKD
ncbi:MAG: thiamine-phosphate kinase, partial [Chloroflexaceae bacterium]|nr:thiamine-phosphate kinase [Chloroflexaceae bacterium]